QKLWHQGLWWPGVRNDLRMNVEKCMGCLRFDAKAEGFHPAKSVIADFPWDHVEIDLIHVPISLEGYVNILTIVDVFSGFTVLRPLKTASMNEVSRVLWMVMSEYGTWKICQSDNGTEFVNEVSRELNSLYGVDNRLTTPYHPRANGLVERKNKEVSRMLKKYMEGSPEHWESWLPLVQLSINAAFSKRTKSAPFSLMFGRQFNGFGDFSDTDTCEDIVEAAEKQLSRSKVLWNVILPGVSEVNRMTKEKLRTSLDTNRKQQGMLLPGTKVMALDQTRGSKWDPVYEGPFTVVRQGEGGAYTLKDAKGAHLTAKCTIDMLRVI
ncbi:MAG: integrase catalytic domain-containing protein, partial [Rhabdochlamydiaceae bacterium]